MKFSKKVVVLVLLLIINFTIAVLYVFLRTGNEPTVLVGAFFGFATIELWSLGKIKQKEVERGCDENDYERTINP